MARYILLSGLKKTPWGKSPFVPTLRDRKDIRRAEGPRHGWELKAHSRVWQLIDGRRIWNGRGPSVGNARAHLCDYGAVLLTASVAAGLGEALAQYFPQYSPIGHTPGALIVIVTSALLLIGSLIILALAAFFHSRPIWLMVILDILVIIGLAGTGFASWFLEANLLLAFMIAGFVGWLWHVSGGGVPGRAAVAVQKEGLVS